MADKTIQELDAIRRAFGPTPAAPAGLRSAAPGPVTLTPQQRRGYEDRRRAAQERAAAIR